MLLEVGTTGYPGNFTEIYDGVDTNSNYSGYDYANDLIDMANYRLSLNQQMNLPPGNNTSVLEKKYRYVLDEVYFHRDNNHYYYPSYPMSLYGENKGSVVNIFLNNADGGTGDGHANMSGDRYTEIRGAWEGYNFVLNDPNYSLDGNLWVVGNAINHEIGHNISLLHTIRYSSGACCDICDDGCDDTPIRQEMLNLGFDPCCGWGGGSISTCSNNQMDYSGSEALTPCQLGKIHYTLMYNMENYLVEDYCNYNPSETIIINEQNVVWNSSKNLIGDLIIKDNASLTIMCEVALPDDASIIIQPEGTLNIDVDAIVTGSCDDLWSGTLLVKSGGTLEIRNGAELRMGGNSTILIDSDGSQIGKLIYNAGSNIILNDNNTVLDIKGNLEISENASFTFTGDGYIKFSNPGGDETNNIFCGSGASFELQGSGKNDKIMEVQQSTVRFPNDLSSLEFRDGKIEMGPDRRMLAEGNPTITFDNVKITSDDGTNNLHRSFVFYGQDDVTIQDCTFKNGKYGLDAHNTYGGASITISGSDFINNQTGLKVYDKGVHLNNCNFYDNTNKAINCVAMSFTSDIINCDIEDNNMGIQYYGSSSSNLNLRTSTILGNGVSGVGIQTFGSFSLNMDNLACNRVSNYSCEIDDLLCFVALQLGETFKQSNIV